MRKKHLILGYFIQVDKNGFAHLYKNYKYPLKSKEYERICSISLSSLDDSLPSFEFIEKIIGEAMLITPKDVVSSVSIHFSEAWLRELYNRSLKV